MRCAGPSDPIHWAGTETSTVNHGAIDGAIRSGERAANEILAAKEAAAGHLATA